MLEFYEAYSNYRDLMDMNEQLFALLAKNITGSTTVKYGEAELDFSKMQRLSMREAIVQIGLPGQARLPPPRNWALQAALRKHQPLQHLGQGRWRTLRGGQAP